MNSKQTRSFGAIQFLYWCGNCAALGYLTPFLSGQGLQADAIGGIMSLGAVCHLLLQPVLGHLADRLGTKRMVAANTAVLAGLSCVLPMIRPGVPFLVLMLLFISLVNSLGLLLDTWLSEWSLRDSRLPFGLIRGIGALGYALSSLATGFLFEQFGSILLFGYTAATTAAMLPVLLCTPKSEPVPAAKKERRPRPARRPPPGKRVSMSKLGFFAFMVCVYMAFRINAVYFPLLLEQQAGGAIRSLGVIYFIMAAGEGLVMWAGDLLRKRFSTHTLLYTGTALMLVRFSLLAVFPGSALFSYLSQAMHAVTYGLIYPLAVRHVRQWATPDSENAESTATLAWSKGLGNFFGPMMGGALIRHMGLGAYPVLCIAFSLAAPGFLFLSRTKAQAKLG